MGKGIVIVSGTMIKQFIKCGFPLPEDALVLGLRHDDWQPRFEILVSHSDIPEVQEGDMLPKLDIELHTKEGVVKFKCWRPLG